MTRVALLAGIVALVFASSASAGVYARISANWNAPGTVAISVLSDHSFNGTVENACVATTVGAANTDATHPLDQWVYDPVAHQYVDNTSFDISAAGAGANCTITVMSGKKLLAQQKYVSV